jgi:organic anion transporter 6A
MIFALVDQSIKLYVAQLSPSRIEEYLMDTSDNFVAFLFSMFVAHFGGRGNRANWVAAGCFLTGIAAIVFAVPFLNFEIIKLSVVKEGEIFLKYSFIYYEYLFNSFWFKKLKIVYDV